MNDMKQLLEFIKNLSINDKKNLSQKALKVSEECGELAKVILPFDGAYATNHRFSTKEKILEQVVDTMLSAISIAYSIECTDDEIKDMFDKKSIYWSELQAKEDKLKYPLPFEIHVTIKRPYDVERYKKDCEEIGVKPIVLDLDNTKIDVMTSSIHYGDNKSAYENMKNVTTGLINRGYTVIREKIETFPFHPAAPTAKDANPTMPKDCYFESHISVTIKKSDKDGLVHLASEHDAHLSRNFFKKIDNNQ